jgi:ArsR family transcriptional regulator
MQSKADQFDTDLAALAEQAKALTHPARLEILQILAEQTTCICAEVVDELPLAQASVSRHLKTLKNAGLVKSTTDGPRVCYCLDVDAVRKFESAMAEFFGPLTSGLAALTSDTDSC